MTTSISDLLNVPDSTTSHDIYHSIRHQPRYEGTDARWMTSLPPPIFAKPNQSKYLKFKELTPHPTSGTVTAGSNYSHSSDTTPYKIIIGILTLVVLLLLKKVLVI